MTDINTKKYFDKNRKYIATKLYVDWKVDKEVAENLLGVKLTDV